MAMAAVGAERRRAPAARGAWLEHRHGRTRRRSGDSSTGGRCRSGARRCTGCGSRRGSERCRRGCDQRRCAGTGTGPIIRMMRTAEQTLGWHSRRRRKRQPSFLHPLIECGPRDGIVHSSRDRSRRIGPTSFGSEIPRGAASEARPACLRAQAQLPVESTQPTSRITQSAGETERDRRV